MDERHFESENTGILPGKTLFHIKYGVDMGESYILELKSIDKSFFGTKVLISADFNVKPG